MYGGLGAWGLEPPLCIQYIYFTWTDNVVKWLLDGCSLIFSLQVHTRFFIFHQIPFTGDGHLHACLLQLEWWLVGVVLIADAADGGPYEPIWLCGRSQSITSVMFHFVAMVLYL